MDQERHTIPLHDQLMVRLNHQKNTKQRQNKADPVLNAGLYLPVRVMILPTIKVVLTEPNSTGINRSPESMAESPLTT